MTGYVHIPNYNLWAPYHYEDGTITIYTRNSFKADADGITITPEIDFKTDYSYFVGNISTSSNLIVFFTRNENSFFSTHSGEVIFGSSSKIDIDFHLLLESHNNLFDNAYFKCEEFNYLYSTNYGLNQEYVIDGKETTSNFSTKKSGEAKKEFEFIVDNKKISACFFVGYTCYSKSKTPILLQSELRFKFEKTNNIDFILNLYNIVKEFLAFICYRSNIVFDDIRMIQQTVHPILTDRTMTLKNLLHDNRIKNIEIEDVKVIQKTIPLVYVENHLSELFTFISNNKLYCEHIPKDTHDDKLYTIGRMILMTAAFEWNANNFLKVEPLSSNRTTVFKDVLDVLADKLEEREYNTKKRKHLKFIVDLIKNSEISLSEKVSFSLEKYKKIMTPFITALYSINQTQFDFKIVTDEMSKRVEYHRNLFAHGNIEKEIYDEIILDLLVLQWLVYCIVLEENGYTEKEIMLIVNEIFHRNLYLKEYFAECGWE